MEPHQFATVPGLHTSRRQIQELITHLPKITESDLENMGHSDSVCPICFNTFLAILAEEEIALVMDSPAHPVEELGVTRLHDTCGHLFCRRDIIKWIRDGRESCPTCRRLFLTVDQRDTEVLRDDFLPHWIVESSTMVGSHSSTNQMANRGELSGMYS